MNLHRFLDNRFIFSALRENEIILLPPLINCCKPSNLALVNGTAKVQNMFPLNFQIHKKNNHEDDV